MNFKLPVPPFLWLLLFGSFVAAAADTGTNVVVIYNTLVPESKLVALHYSERRNVPAQQLIGLELPISESMTRAEFNKQLRDPLRAQLRSKNLFPSAQASNSVRSASAIRYLALCYGVPNRVVKDLTLVEPDPQHLQADLQRNEASVDSELMCLPMESMRLTGALLNPGYAATNPIIQLQPANGIFLVTRLDGPSAAIANTLVDRAMEAETNGLWGRGYFDLRGVTDAAYKPGDDMIRHASESTVRAGFDAILDEKPETFSAGFPMSHIAFYAGWYDANVSGPFTNPPVEFMPGAIAYHLHSFSALSIRTTNTYWVGPLLAAGATATMGCVDEPYLSGTPDISILFSRMFAGYTFGEAACAAQGVVSWQTIAVGDPLYRPFGTPPGQLHASLVQRQSAFVQFSFLRAANLNLATGTSTDEVLDYLLGLEATRQSACLTEKTGDLLLSKKRMSDAVDTYAQVLKRNPSRQQRIRIELTMARLAASRGRAKAAADLYEQFLTDHPSYPDLLLVYREALPSAQTAGRTALAERCRSEIKRLAPALP